MGLLTASELGAIRALGELGMITEVTVTRSTIEPVNQDDPSYDPSTDYGDDNLSDFAPVSGALQPVGVTMSWFLTAPLATGLGTGQAILGAIERHIVRMPVGTDVKSQDVLVVTETGYEYLVTDTNSDDTWPEWLEANAERRE